jgi:UMF1 family MFS transporter
MSKNDPRVTNGWAMYDWANSVYPLVITTTIFPIYFNAQAELAAVARDKGARPVVEFAGMPVVASSLLIYAISAAFLIVAVLSPLLTALADYSGYKKRFMQFFCYLGAASCAALFCFTEETLSLAVLLYISATVGFAGSLVFYNSFLPDIATEDRVDSLSARGFSFGYIGSAALLIGCLAMVTCASSSGMDKALASRLSFLLTGLWWGGFALIPFARLPPDRGCTTDAAEPSLRIRPVLFHGYRQLVRIWRELRGHPALKRFLLSYFFSSTGVQTVLYVATPFASGELKMGPEALITTVLVLQLVGVAGAGFFARLSDALGNVRALSTAVLVWFCVCVAGYFVQAGWSFYALASCIGFAMGGVQSLARSTYAKLIPDDARESASWFSFFDVTEKLAIVVGTATFSLISQVSGSMRNSLLALTVFFAIGLALLLALRGKVLRLRAAALPLPGVTSGER